MLGQRAVIQKTLWFADVRKLIISRAASSPQVCFAIIGSESGQRTIKICHHPGISPAAIGLAFPPFPQASLSTATVPLRCPLVRSFSGEV
jgi:hypothetical protein